MARRTGDRIPVGSPFAATVQTGPRAHPASYKMGTGSFPGVKRPSRYVKHSLSSSAEAKEKVKQYLYSSPVSSWPVLRWILLFWRYLLYRYSTAIFYPGLYNKKLHYLHPLACQHREQQIFETPPYNPKRQKVYMKQLH